MKKIYIILPIIILICIGGKIGYSHYEKNKEYERTMIEANNAMKSKDYQTVLNTLMYAKSLKKGSKEITELEEKANLEIENNEKIERAKALFNESKHKQAIHILEKIENNDEAKKLLKQVQTDYNNKLAAEEREREQKIFAENLSKLPREELEKSSDTINKNLDNITVEYLKDIKLNPSDFVSIRQPGEDDGLILGGSSILSKKSSVLDKKWSELADSIDSDEFELNYESIKNAKAIVDYDETVSDTIKTFIDKIDSAHKGNHTHSTDVLDSECLIEFNIQYDNSSSDNIKTLFNNIRKGVDEIVDGEIKRLQEISNQSNIYLDYDKLKDELHPGIYDRINIKFMQYYFQPEKICIIIDFLKDKTDEYYYYDYGELHRRYGFNINSKEAGDMLKAIDSYCFLKLG